MFCDKGTPSAGFNVYDELRDRLAAAGLDPARVRYIHEANTDQAKERLFNACRSGEVDVLIGSTEKMGVGTNIQARLVALHHLDAPWRPADIEQREGRILRHGNQNRVVHVVRYVTEGSFDPYMWQTLERKARFIAQVMSPADPHDAARSIEDLDTEVVLSYAEIKAVATGNPLIREQAEVAGELARLSRLAANHTKAQRAPARPAGVPPRPSSNASPPRSTDSTDTASTPSTPAATPSLSPSPTAPPTPTGPTPAPPSGRRPHRSQPTGHGGRSAASAASTGNGSATRPRCTGTTPTRRSGSSATPTT